MTDKERLEEIKIMVKLEKQGKESGISTSDFDYLISRIDELEEKVLNKNIIIRHSSEEKEEIQQEKSKWKDTAQSYYMTNQELREQNKRYREYLELIRITGTHGKDIKTGEIIRSDEANLANEALEGESE